MNKIKKTMYSAKWLVMSWFGLSLMLQSCGGGEKGAEGSAGGELKPAEGYFMDGDKKVKIYYGGIFRMNEVESFKNLFPHAMIDAVSFRIANQVYQGLYKLDQKSLLPVNCLAESETVSEDAKIWTFKIRKGVFFHDDACFSGGKGREVTAKDVKYCFDMLCEARPDNQLAELFTARVVGAQEYYDATKGGSKPKDGVKGIELVDDYTIKITLISSYSGFNSLLAHNACYIFPKEAYDKYGNEMRTKCVGTGPFYIDAIEEGTQVRMLRNPNYWEVDENGNKLPYLDIVKITFTKDKKSELANFRQKNLDMVWKLPVDEMDAVLVDLDNAMNGGNTEFKYQQINGLAIQFYAFNSNSTVFNDVKIRKAFNHAIDREALVKYTIKGEGEPADHGLVPKFFGYDNSVIEGFNYDPDLAKKMLAEAGYPNGKGFPKVTLLINEGGSTNTILAEGIHNMIKENLGVELDIEILQFPVLLERITTGQADFWRTAWLADYPDPANFLALFYGKNVPADPNAYSFPNSSRYKNATFDSYYEKAMASLDDEERMSYYQKCDSILIADAAFIPLYYDQYIRLIQQDIVGFPINAMEYRDLSRVFKSK
jgi:oligopeptide transport system substrate-binding protein